jgi:hypothetical protein
MNPKVKKAAVAKKATVRKTPRKPQETELLPVVVSGPKAQKLLKVNKFVIARLVRQKKLVPCGKNEHHRGGGYLFNREDVDRIASERKTAKQRQETNKRARVKAKPLNRKALEKQGQKRLPLRASKARKRVASQAAT